MWLLKRDISYFYTMNQITEQYGAYLKWKIIHISFKFIFIILEIFLIFLIHIHHGK